MQKEAEERVLECKTELKEIQRGLDAFHTEEDKTDLDEGTNGRKRLQRKSAGREDFASLSSSEDEDEKPLGNRKTIALDSSDDDSMG